MKRIFKWLALWTLLWLLPLPIQAAEAPFRDGDQVVIYAPAAGKALSARQSGYYNNSVSVSLDAGILTGFGDTEVWTVRAGPDGWQLLSGEQALSMGSQYTYLSLGEVHDCWTLESTGENRWQLRNTGRQNLLCMNSRRFQWLTCTTPGATDVTEFALWVLPREEEAPALPPVESQEGYQLYFGLLHSHSDLSDGSSSVEERFAQAAQTDGMDFFAVTDHSHSLDNAEAATLSNALSEDWSRGKAAARAATGEGFVGIYGFEMGWNQGQGHMNTYRTPGFLSRETPGYRDYAGGMEAYYAALLEAPQSISQFNHPGVRYGSFKTFASYSPELDQRITLMEVEANTEYYDQALSLGWHLAPTASMEDPAVFRDDSRCRTVLLAEALTEDALYDAMENYRAYATFDADLEILFTLNGQIMGSRVSRSQIGTTVTLDCDLYDPTDSTLGTLEVVTEGGLVLETLDLYGCRSTVALNLPANRDYYYLRLTQPDGDWAVTAPVFLETWDDMGIASIEAAPVTTAGEEAQITVTLYNNEPEPLYLSGVTLTADGKTMTDPTVTAIAPFRTAVCTFSCTLPIDGIYELTAACEGSYGGEPRTFSKVSALTVMPPALVDDVLLDFTHGSGERFHNIMAHAEKQDVDMQTVTEVLTFDALKTCRLLVIPAPAEEPDSGFLGLLADHVGRGGSLLLCGTSPEADPEALPWLNQMLEFIGASGRFLPEEARDPVNNSGQPHQLRTTVFSHSIWLADLEAGQYFRQDRGCAIDPGGGQWLIKGLETAASPVLLSAEELPGGGTVFLAGCSFLSDDYILIPQDTLWEQPSANQTIAETLLGLLRTGQKPIPIEQLRAAQTGRIYLAEGRVTAGTANPHTTFPNTIYIQDDAGGIAATGYSAHGLPLGTRVRILGVLDTDGENPALRILRLTELEKEPPLLPREAVPAEAEGGGLLSAEGTVTAVTAAGSAVSRFTLENGDTSVEVLIEESIHSGSRGLNELARIVRAGNSLRAVGLCHRTGDQWVLRVRDCDEITLLEGQPGTLPTDPSAEELPEEDPEAGPDEDLPGGPDDLPADNPDTGDPIGKYLLLLCLSAVGMCLLTQKRR